MKPHQFVLALVLFIGILSFLGSMIFSGTENYNVTPSNEFSTTMTGNNYSAYQQEVKNLENTAKNTGAEDGFLAQYKLGIATMNLVSSSVSQAGSLVTGIGDFLGLPPQLVALLIVVIIVLAIFGGIYLIIG